MKKTLIFSIIALLLISVPVAALSADTARSDIASGQLSYDESGNVHHFYYANEYMQKQQSKIVQLTPEQLSLPTDELVDLVLDFPFWIVYLSSTYPYAKTYEIITTAYEYNGFAELEKRPDSASVMLCRFKELVKESDYGSLHASYLYFILSTPVYYDRLMPEELAEFERVCDEYHTAHTWNNSATNNEPIINRSITSDIHYNNG